MFISVFQYTRRLSRALSDTINNAVQSAPHRALLIIVFTCYLIGAQSRLKGASANNHFAYLAQAFLAGQTALLTPPPHGNDWASYEVLTLRKISRASLERTRNKGHKGLSSDSSGSSKSSESSDLKLNPKLLKSSSQFKKKALTLKGIFIGSAPRQGRAGEFRTLGGLSYNIKRSDIHTQERRYFVSFPPLPALLMLPWVALFGLAASDVWLTLICAALNASLALSLFRQISNSNAARRAGLKRSDSDLIWCVMSLTLGTAHFWCAVRGEVWFTALIVGVTAQLLFFRWAWGMRRPLLAGWALAAAFSTRASLITLALFFYIQVMVPFNETPRRERWRRALIFSLPPLAVGLTLLSYNTLRFERWYEFGHSYLAGGQIKRVQEYGLFNVAFLSKNIIAAFLLLPLIAWRAPHFIYSWHGQAIQWSSPQLMWALLPNRQRSPLTRPRVALSLVLVATLSLLLLYQNTGWVQYSWRFGLDLIPALSCLIVTTDRALGRVFKAATLWGVTINLIGALAFGRGALWIQSVNTPLLSPH